MLLTKTVKMKWNPKNKKWYESKGYIFTKWKNEFEVKVEDLTNSSSAKINIQCNKCGEILKNVKWQNYKKYVKENGKYYCQLCGSNIFGREKTVKTRLKNGKSFKQWCVKNNCQDILDRWDYELNDCDPSEINYGTNKKYYFKCPKGMHKSELKKIDNLIRKKIMKCNQCNSFAQHLEDLYGENALDLYWDYDKNKNINPWDISLNSEKLIWIKCQNKDYHDSYKTKCTSFSTMDCRCPYCTNRNGKVHLLDSLGVLHPSILQIWSDKNKKSPYEYSSFSNQYIWWKCLDGKHDDYKRRISNSTRHNFRCPECVRERDESFLQEKVRLYLNTFNYNTLHEYNCNIIAQNPKIKNKRGQLPYDNEVVDLKLIIEVMGKQHYKLTNFHFLSAKKYNTDAKYELHMIQVRDRYKRMYAKSKQYNYLEIPYWTDDKKETWKQMINNKIDEIINLIET